MPCVPLGLGRDCQVLRLHQPHHPARGAREVAGIHAGVYSSKVNQDFLDAEPLLNLLPASLLPLTS